MGKLIYSAITSLDGYIADERGDFDWAVPDEEVLAFINDLIRPTGTYLYGRRMYEMMTVWETDPSAAAQSPRSRDFAEIWVSADKVVYSTTLREVPTTKTRLERDFEHDAVRSLKESAGHDLAVAGADLAAQAIKAGLVDEFHMILAPVAVGGGTQAFPENHRVDLELLEKRLFDNGMIYLYYRSRT